MQQNKKRSKKIRKILRSLIFPPAFLISLFTYHDDLENLLSRRGAKLK